MKYMITNCPCYNKDYSCQSKNNIIGKYCKDITDCLLKQIAEKCKYEKDKGYTMSRYGCKVPVSEGYDLASEILELPEIEECE